MSAGRFRCRALRRSGATEVRVVLAENEEAARDRLVAAGLEPISIEPIGPSLFSGMGGWRLPQWRLPRIATPRGPALIAIALLLSIPFTVAAGAWWQAREAMVQNQALQFRYGRDSGKAVLSQAERERLASDLSRRTIGDLVVRLAAVLPSDAMIHAAKDDGDYGLKIEIDASDPDRLRAALAADPLFAHLRETAQDRTESGTMRVTLEGQRP